MKREERWKAFAEAHEAVKAAMAQLDTAPSRQTRDGAREADRVYQLCLAKVIGLQPVMRYGRQVQAYLEGVDRDAESAEITFLRGALKIAAAEVEAAVERARARDNEPDEKGGA